MITRRYQKYDFSKIRQKAWNNSAFAVIFNAIPDRVDGVIVSGAGFSISVKTVSRSCYSEKEQFCCNWFFERDEVKIIEVSARFAGEDEPYVIGFPLYLISGGGVEHEFAATYDGVWFSIFCDGVLYDRDSPDGGRLESDKAPEAKVSNVVLTGDISCISSSEYSQYIDKPIFCYTPAGFNTWVGDVVLSSFKGVFHCFYLHDRHHHASRKGRGAHVFCHLTTTDFIDWIDHGEVITFDKPCLTVGTGNSFVLDDKLYLAFGWHTERSKPVEECAAFHLEQEFKKTGVVKSKRYDELKNIYPSGATYAVSCNGVDFTYSNKIIHYVENPNITVMPDGSLRLCEYGIWQGNSLDSWQVVDPDFLPRLENSLARNTTECPCFFTLGNREYLMIGFTGFYRKDDDGSWQELWTENRDFYDGMAVPMAVSHGNRVIAGAWMNSPDWGSFLMLRELIMLGDGGVGCRWLAETLPPGEFYPLAGNEKLTISAGNENTKISVQASGRVVIHFSGDGDEFFLVVDSGSAAWSSDVEKKPEFFDEVVKRNREAKSFRDLAGEPLHVWGENFARRINTGKDFLLKIIVHNEQKFHGAAVDVEIDGKYTIATYRRKIKRVNCVEIM